MLARPSGFLEQQWRLSWKQLLWNFLEQIEQDLGIDRPPKRDPQLPHLAWLLIFCKVKVAYVDGFVSGILAKYALQEAVNKPNRSPGLIMHKRATL